jgi:hypothetical protein
VKRKGLTVIVQLAEELKWDDHQEFEELLRLPAEKLLLRWMNYHLKKAGYQKVVSNYSSDIKVIGLPKKIFCCLRQ